MRNVEIKKIRWLRDRQSVQSLLYTQITFISIVPRVCKRSDRYFRASWRRDCDYLYFAIHSSVFVESITPRKLYADFSLAQCLIGIKASAGSVTQRAKLSYFPRERHAATARVTTTITGNVSVGLEIFARRLRVGLSDTIEMRAIISPLFQRPFCLTLKKLFQHYSIRKRCEQ